MSEPKKMALIASKGTLDWAYPPFILASTAAAMDMEVSVFFTFYGLTLLKKDIKVKVAPATNPAMPMKMPFGPNGIFMGMAGLVAGATFALISFFKRVNP